MAPRPTRAEQTERNRAALLGAARRVFMTSGYHGATLEKIADEAGFSKGVVYSQFDGKADLFLSLLDARIEQRAANNSRLLEALAAEQGIVALTDQLTKIDPSEAAWLLLVAEFRVHAARDAELNRRYAARHARTVDGLAKAFAAITDRTSVELPFAPRRMAEVALALEFGGMLEQAANPDSLGGSLLRDVLASLLGGHTTGRARSGTRWRAGE
ncbi:MAG: TetR/AcrR family transcriptional regulator [Solirubrobacteraceae bacterium]